jgi:hypothetical protein
LMLGPATSTLLIKTLMHLSSGSVLSRPNNEAEAQCSVP